MGKGRQKRLNNLNELIIEILIKEKYPTTNMITQRLADKGLKITWPTVNSYLISLEKEGKITSVEMGMNTKIWVINNRVLNKH